DQVSKTIVATVDLQFLGGLFQYALAALAKDGSGIQFDRDYVNLFPDLTINGRIYSDADIRWGDNRALPPMLQTHSMAVDLGPNSPIQSRQDLQNVPAQVPVERLGAPLAYPTYDQMVASLQTRNGSQITNVGPSNGSGLLISMFGMCIYIDFPMIRFIQGNQAILMFSNPDLYVLGNPYGKTIISEGNVHLIGLVGNSTDRTLYIAKGNVWVGDNQIPNDLRAVIETLNRAVGWLLDGLRFLLHLIGLDNLLNLNDNLIQPLSNILRVVLDLIHDVIPPWRISGYIYAPNGTVNFGLAALGIQGGVAARQIHFNVLNSIDINYQNTDLMADFDPSRRPELYIPQPVIVERHTE
ncbi:hypothetical protein, partial [Kyrpidia sp.]|uniref:hypothetical protein n=1 Tax=Kyrpidia sp. TaxID=2073077 RepID=UPI002588DB6A